MAQNLWQVFMETGDPLCYLLYCADSRRQSAAQVLPSDGHVLSGNLPADSMAGVFPDQTRPSGR